MSAEPVHHDTFVIERTFPSAPSEVFRALTDPEAKGQWFRPPSDWSCSDYRFDCRVGGTEHMESRAPDGKTHTYDAIYREVVPDQRLIFAYDMHMDDERISVSLTTIELAPVDAGTRVTFTEQGAFLEGGAEGAASRLAGSHQLLDSLGNAVDGSS